jgi:hypothetical protein
MKMLMDKILREYGGQAYEDIVSGEPEISVTAIRSSLRSEAGWWEQ